eukprot:TRINITY_DN25126_c0_g1_i1.p1 TRINITY_DN25126_c0_g1~~TRINITY_DN25126_c0_g1_i1.p1  ORF type:complete len:213 (-),score=27.72 TRINITY_DN25126_c0_g1_i1:447-1085(-)
MKVLLEAKADVNAKLGMRLPEGKGYVGKGHTVTPFMIWDRDRKGKGKGGFGRYHGYGGGLLHFLSDCCGRLDSYGIAGAAENDVICRILGELLVAGLDPDMKHGHQLSGKACFPAEFQQAFELGIVQMQVDATSTGGTASFLDISGNLVFQRTAEESRQAMGPLIWPVLLKALAVNRLAITFADRVFKRPEDVPPLEELVEATQMKGGSAAD